MEKVEKKDFLEAGFVLSIIAAIGIAAKLVGLLPYDFLDCVIVGTIVLTPILLIFKAKVKQIFRGFFGRISKGK